MTEEFDFLKFKIQKPDDKSRKRIYSSVRHRELFSYFITYSLRTIRNKINHLIENQVKV